MQTDEMWRKRGFTMIELLTVIAIIAFLAALLLPTLKSAREKTKRAVCASNLKHIGLAIYAYASDNDKHTPTINANAQSQNWYEILLTGNYCAMRIFKCPTDTLRRSTVGIPRSYAMGVGSNGTEGTFWIAGVKLGCYWHGDSSRLAMVGERVTPTALMNNSPTGTYFNGAKAGDVWVRSEHYKSATNSPQPIGNYLFMDGHVEWVQSPLTRLEMFDGPPAGWTNSPCL